MTSLSFPVEIEAYLLDFLESIEENAIHLACSELPVSAVFHHDALQTVVAHEAFCKSVCGREAVCEQTAVLIRV